MSIWDGDANSPNIPFPTFAGHFFWDTIESRSGYELQQHKGTKHCRILNQWNIRIAWGDEGPMRAKFYELTNPDRSIRAKCGDIIGVHRLAGMYDHYGVYESDNCIYEYGITGNGICTIHTTTLKEFIGSSDGYFILVFPEVYGALGKIHVGESEHSFRIKQHNLSSSNLLIPAHKRLKARDHYKIYTPHETISRARSKLGEMKYNLLFRNCEHFAIWCKTGMADSHQINSLVNDPIIDAIMKEESK